MFYRFCIRLSFKQLFCYCCLFISMALTWLLQVFGFGGHNISMLKVKLSNVFVVEIEKKIV